MRTMRMFDFYTYLVSADTTSYRSDIEVNIRYPILNSEYCCRLGGGKCRLKKLKC